MKKYVLFDLDGTLSDPKVGITTCVQLALSHFGIHEENLDVLEPFIGPPLKESFMNFYGLSEEEAVKAIEVYRSRFSTIGMYENEMYPGVDHMLRRLCEAGYQLCVASSKPTVFVEQILEHFDIKKYFNHVVGSFLDGRRVEKEEVVEEALRLLGVTGETKSEAVMIGDRKFDVVGAKSHGVSSIAVSYGYGTTEELEAENPDYLVTSVTELEELLLLLHQSR